MAQVLYYHHARSVTQTTHEMSGYVTKRGVNVIAIPAGSFIDWDNMVEKYGRNIETTMTLSAMVMMARASSTSTWGGVTMVPITA